MTIKNKKKLYIAFGFLCFIIILYIFSKTFLSAVGKFLVVDDSPSGPGVVVVLNTGVDYYPRLIEAADLYKKGLAKKIIINGNRKTEALRDLEKKGFEPCCSWYEDRLRILELYDVRRDDVITVSVEDAFDTISEAEAVGEEILRLGMSDILIVTSKSHTRRARYIWTRIWGDKARIKMVSAREDPFDPGGWWKSGRQIKWVMSEYGAWGYAVFSFIGRD